MSRASREYSSTVPAGAIEKFRAFLEFKSTNFPLLSCMVPVERNALATPSLKWPDAKPPSNNSIRSWMHSSIVGFGNSCSLLYSTLYLWKYSTIRRAHNRHMCIDAYQYIHGICFCVFLPPVLPITARLRLDESSLMVARFAWSIEPRLTFQTPLFPRHYLFPHQYCQT